MKVYLTECDGWACADIKAQSIHEAEYLVGRYIREELLPPRTKVVGELVEDYDYGRRQETTD